MDLKLEIKSSSMRDKSFHYFQLLNKQCVFKKDNYFLMIQMDELQFPDKILKTTKFRTEIIPLSFYPEFKKNLFIFPNLSLGHIFKKFSKIIYFFYFEIEMRVF